MAWCGGWSRTAVQSRLAVELFGLGGFASAADADDRVDDQGDNDDGAEQSHVDCGAGVGRDHEGSFHAG
jgi:hypothetical protein